MARPANRFDSFLTLGLDIGPGVRILSTKAIVVFTLAMGVICAGCGKSDVAQGPSDNAGNSPANTAMVAPATSPTDLVSQFLDQVRRGGPDSDAGRFLTQKAQSELKRIGRSVQPIGSPAARFDVIQAVEVPDEQNAMLVESLWTEPMEDGSKVQLQVVWSVEKETAGWRISGLAILEQGATKPDVVDFENGDLMAQLLADEPPTSAAKDDNLSQAAAPSGGLSR